MIPPSHGLGILDLVMGACLKTGFVPRIAQEAKEIQTVVGFVAAGFGVPCSPKPCAGSPTAALSTSPSPRPGCSSRSPRPTGAGMLPPC